MIYSAKVVINPVICKLKGIFNIILTHIHIVLKKVPMPKKKATAFHNAAA